MALRSILRRELPAITLEALQDGRTALTARTGIQGDHYACGCVLGTAYVYLCAIHAGHAEGVIAAYKEMEQE